jgi:PTS system nitrogen regulatory IIA component
MRLRDYLQDDLVVSGLEATSMDEVFSAFQGLMEDKGLVTPPSGIQEALRTREEAHTTVLGKGVAVPHATVPSLESVVLMVGITRAPVDFGPPETDPVDVYFVLLSPKGWEGNHIKLLARICRLARLPGFLDELRGAQGKEAIMATLLRVDSEHV